MPLQVAVSVGQDPPLSSIDISASQAVPTCISSWSSSGDDHAPTPNPKLHGVAIGCQDGSVFLYRSSHERSEPSSSRPRLSLPVDSLEPLSRPSSPLRFPGLGRRSVRSSSPSSMLTVRRADHHRGSSPRQLLSLHTPSMSDVYDLDHRRCPSPSLAMSLHCEACSSLLSSTMHC